MITMSLLEYLKRNVYGLWNIKKIQYYKFILGLRCCYSLIKVTHKKHINVLYAYVAVLGPGVA